MKKILLIIAMLCFSLMPVHGEDGNINQSVARVLLHNGGEVIGVAAITVGDDESQVEYFVTTHYAKEAEDIYIVPDKFDRTTQEEDVYKANIVYNSDDTGIAIIRSEKVIEDRYVPARLGEVEDLEKGTKIVSLGFPYLRSSGENGSTSLDVIENVGTIESNLCTSQISPYCLGMSEEFDLSSYEGIGYVGGPVVVDESDEVIGMRNVDEEDTGCQYMINAQTIMEVLDEEDIPYQKAGGGFLSLDIPQTYWVVGGIVVVILIVLLAVRNKAKQKTVSDHQVQNDDIVQRKSPIDMTSLKDVTTLPQEDTAPQPAITKWILKGQTGHFQGATFLIDGSIKIGRRGDQAHLVIDDDQQISALHCLISQENEKIYIEDCRSSNGTWLNQSRLQPHQKYLLSNGDIISLGQNQSFVIIKE